MALEFFPPFLWSFSRKLNDVSDFAADCIDHEIILKILVFFLNSVENVKPGFLLSLVSMFPESKGIKFWSHSFQLQNSAILQDRVDQRGDSMKMSFNNFQIQQLISQIARAQKVDEKSGVICLVFFFPSWVMVLKLPKIVSLL